MVFKKGDNKGVSRQTLSKALKANFPDLFKRPSGGPRISTAALEMLSKPLRDSVMAELKKKSGAKAVSYNPEEVGEFVLSFPGLPCNK